MVEEQIKLPHKLDSEITNHKRAWATSVAVRMADEGIPIGAIVRSVRVSSDVVRPALKAAQERGFILTIPRDDWPPGTRRSARVPDCVPVDISTDTLVSTLMRVFKVTPAQATILAQLLKRPEVTKSALHLCVQREGNEITDPKIVDVLICHLRKRLPADVKIETIWGRGYYLSPSCKAAALARIDKVAG